MERSTILLACFIIGVSHGYRHYQDDLPNGDAVPHPCKTNFLWRGVGHKNPQGGGDRNPFGLDFQQVKQWTKELCQKDSDGDGMTNGQELGDPDCVWHPGNFPSRIKNITHPGICDPWGSPQCTAKNDWVSCTAGEFICNATKEPDVKSFTLRYPPTRVPPTETNYYCMPFDVSDYIDMSKDYHMIATKPEINNSNVMHHIVLYGCSDDAPMSDHATPCYMSQKGCSEVLGLWTLGLDGTCEYKDAGYRIGRTGSKKMVMQFHWTNPELRSDYVDSSGLTLYYTPKLRKYDAGFLFTGQVYLEIPPGVKRSTFESTCTEECTNKLMTGNIYITSGLSHMHYLGFNEQVELFRNGQSMRKVIDDPTYSYDNPQLKVYSNPIEMRQGDSLKTTCVYRSVSKTRTTMYGEGSYDEMCYGLFSYFPKQNMSGSCTTWKNFDLCQFENEDHIINGCDIPMFENLTSPEMRAIVNEVMDSCNHYGSCRPECPAVLDRLNKHPCLQGELGELLLYGFAGGHDSEKIKFAHALRSCDKAEEPVYGYFPISAASAASSVVSGIVVAVITALGL
ncbi:tyramine beta-hydroxylase-like [Haliotis rubra]|uniref:tyramine beta-hydroxylase-like n=1 Tax=Haliotis rubra TaxID=36100 RepID=UPI001EE56FFB|nr:tyramine beta-hydroxylase-like [Haliotis rubra]